MIGCIAFRSWSIGTKGMSVCRPRVILALFRVGAWIGNVKDTTSFDILRHDWYWQSLQRVIDRVALEKEELAAGNVAATAPSS
jgi:hypothetical protein